MKQTMGNIQLKSREITQAIKGILLLSMFLNLIACEPFTIAGLYFLHDKNKGDKQKIALYNVRPYTESAHQGLYCAQRYSNTSHSCKLSQLPLLAQQTSNPSLNDIESRLLVSHHWMGERFMEILESLPDDIPVLMGSITAIVIASNIRPSFYTTETGAIYLDPNYLWLSEEEKNTISNQVDFRSGFANELNFTSLWRYLDPNGAWARLPNSDRQIDDLSFPLARLLYHELAHANTFFPMASLNSITLDNTIVQAANEVIDYNIAIKLNDFKTLNSELMLDLSEVMFQGKKATSAQKSLTATEVANAFSSDRATDDYAYVSYDPEREIFYEDVALLFEELMAKHHFNHDREIAYTNAANSSSCADYVIAWGQTGRIGHSDAKSAVRLVADNILPLNNLGPYIDSLANPIQTQGINWCSALEKNLNLYQGKHNSLLHDASVYEIDIRENLLPPHES